MSEDTALNAMFDFSAYDEFVKDAMKDTAVGPQEFLVGEVHADAWPDGSPRLKVRGQLTSAGNVIADITFSEPPPIEVLREMEKAGTMDAKRKRGIAATVNLYKQLAQHYGISPKQIRPGEVYKVQVARDKRNADGTGGFLRVRAFLSKDHVVGTPTGGTAAVSSPF